MSQEPDKPTIMVVDDEEDIRSVLSEWLELHSYHIVEAANGQEAVEKALRLRPDLILMDLRMPSLNGISATRQLREHPQLREVPIVITSALDPVLFRDAAFSVGCTAFITKPIDFAQLENLLNRLLGKG